jgi:hypothetical protein
MRRVLVLYFSQTGQLRDIVRSTLAPLERTPEFEVDIVELKPEPAYPFPWPFFRFFNTFPETVYEDTGAIEPPDLDADKPYDLIVMAYTVWFLQPALPIVGFLKSQKAKRVFAGKPVITLIGCRNMWLMAQERMKELLKGLGARLIDNIVLTDSAHSAFTFFSTPMWMLFGKRGPFFNGAVPRAGISEEDIAACERFGRAIATQLPKRETSDVSPMLTGLGAVHVREGLIESEKTIKRSFRLWGALLRSLGKPDALARQFVILLYFLFLFLVIITIVPILAVVKMILKPLARASIAKQREYFAAPSGESSQLLERGA